MKLFNASAISFVKQCQDQFLTSHRRALHSSGVARNSRANFLVFNLRGSGCSTPLLHWRYIVTVFFVYCSITIIVVVFCYLMVNTDFHLLVSKISKWNLQNLSDFHNPKALCMLVVCGVSLCLVCMCLLRDCVYTAELDFEWRSIFSVALTRQPWDVFVLWQDIYEPRHYGPTARSLSVDVRYLGTCL